VYYRTNLLVQGLMPVVEHQSQQKRLELDRNQIGLQKELSKGIE
jgi:hypothetical protein